MTLRAFIQARMNSERFPGKVLAPLWGTPIISHVISRVSGAVSLSHVTVATSTERSDDPLAKYLQSEGVSVFRWPLDDVFQRFRLCLEEYPCDWFFRICSDYPLLYHPVIR